MEATMGHFLLLTLGPPLYILFPYTTLFRSRLQRVSIELASPQPAAERGAAGAQAKNVHRFRHRGPQERDRKSTRLNSSHRCTSYAVFCWKKKRHTLDARLTIRNNLSTSRVP